jgi:hypothetical protein
VHEGSANIGLDVFSVGAFASCPFLTATAVMTIAATTKHAVTLTAAVPKVDSDSAALLEDEHAPGVNVAHPAHAERQSLAYVEFPAHTGAWISLQTHGGCASAVGADVEVATLPRLATAVGLSVFGVNGTSVGAAHFVTIVPSGVYQLALQPPQKLSWHVAVGANGQAAV